MTTWPTTLPDFFSGIADKKGTTKARSSVDVGPAIVRRRYTAAVRNVDIPMILTNAERIIFDAFYSDDLDEGTLSFDWVDPVTGTTVSMRFRADDGPAFTGSGGGEVQRWSATLELEILP